MIYMISDEYPLPDFRGTQVDVIDFKDSFCHIVLIDPKLSTSGAPITDFWVNADFVKTLAVGG
jgi:hypothetical protein